MVALHDLPRKMNVFFSDSEICHFGCVQKWTPNSSSNSQTDLLLIATYMDQGDPHRKPPCLSVSVAGRSTEPTVFFLFLGGDAPINDILREMCF